MSNLRKILDSLDLPPYGPAELIHTPKASDPHLHYADMNGYPFRIPGSSPFHSKGVLNDYDEASRLQSEHVRKTDPEAFLRAYFNDGTTVLTSYLGWSEQYLKDQPALVWETLIYLEGNSTWQRRYTTQLAANHAHTTIIKALERSGLTCVKREKGISKGYGL